MCAITAGRRGRRVLVLEGSNRIGKKILMSGGGRCNFTNLYCEPSNFVSANPSFCISALSRYSQWDFIALVEQHNIPYHEKTAGQLFCDRSSKDIVAMLQAECDAAGVSIQTRCGIKSIDEGNGFTVHGDKGTFGAKSLVVATGGLSIPRMGATDFGYRLARQFGIGVLDTRAGLVPFTFSGRTKDLTTSLAGVSVPAGVSTNPGTISRRPAVYASRPQRSGRLAGVQLLEHGRIAVRRPAPGTGCGSRILVDRKKTQPRALLRSILSESLPRALVVELQPVLWPHACGNTHRRDQRRQPRTAVRRSA